MCRPWYRKNNHFTCLLYRFFIAITINIRTISRKLARYIPSNFRSTLGVARAWSHLSLLSQNEEQALVPVDRCHQVSPMSSKHILRIITQKYLAFLLNEVVSNLTDQNQRRCCFCNNQSRSGSYLIRKGWFCNKKSLPHPSLVPFSDILGEPYKGLWRHLLDLNAKVDQMCL